VSASRCRLLLALVAGLLVTVGPAEALFRPDSRGSQKIRLNNTSVTIIVPASAFDRRTGTAVVTVPRAITGEVHSSQPWTLRVRAESGQVPNRGGTDTKSCSDLAARGSGEPSFRPLSVTPTAVIVGDKTHGWEPIAIDLQLTAQVSADGDGDAAGAYNFSIRFDID